MLYRGFLCGSTLFQWILFTVGSVNYPAQTFLNAATTTNKIVLIFVGALNALECV